ncbi:MAG: IS200/IS605 family transposase [Leptolyngbyaceae cyanobacterium SU_3_3]|nr:IS200/IS605 family transposase [Leptolyngbyaceae cyanobacterium SU_3_3]
MALWRLYYHFVWVTKNREPLIDLNKENDLHNYIVGKADSLKCIIHDINGTSNHIHLITSVPPILAISEFVKNIKGSSAYYINHTLSPAAKNFRWQAGYGVFSLGHKQLEQAVTYVENQKIHHKEGTVISILEQESEQDDQPERLHWALSGSFPKSPRPPGN